MECVYAENADLVGAINILAAGNAALACGVTAQKDRTVKHEPAEGIRKSSRKPVEISCFQEGRMSKIYFANGKF